MMSVIPAINFHVPTDLRFGSGRFNELSTLAPGLGTHALVVTGRTAMERLGYTAQTVRSLKQAGIEATVYSSISPSPTVLEVDGGAQLARNSGTDFILALGGGSAIDAAKGISAVLSGSQPALEYLFNNAEVSSSAHPLIAIPTTAGTGSELNKSGIVTDPNTPWKDGIRSKYLFPKIALVDPMLTHSVPKYVTATTGFDALAHAIESYVSPKSTPFGDMFALAAVENISTYLPVALATPKDSEARAHMALAATSMGFNLSCVGTCFPHRVDKALCAYNPEIAHGQSLAMFYPHWAKMSWEGNVEKFANLTRILKPGDKYSTSKEAASSFQDAIVDFIEQIGLSKKLRDFEVFEDQIPELSAAVAGDLTVNPVPIKKEDLPEILREIITS